MPFESNVFINCPFDSSYSNLLRPLLFTVLYFKLEPQISENKSSGIVRVDQIKKMILDSQFSIHDISRSEGIKAGELPRLNMSFEMGLDFGCQSYGTGPSKNKKCLVLEKTRFHYQKVVSDIAGQDIEFHDNDPEVLVRKVRNWFSTVLNKHLASPSEIWEAYVDCYQRVSRMLKEKQKFSTVDIESLPYSNFITLVKGWMEDQKSK